MAGVTTFLTMFYIISLPALIFSPPAKMIGGGSQTSAGMVLYRVTVPGLIIIGSLMMKGVKRIVTLLGVLLMIRYVFLKS